jgi:hypothetical protein
MNDPQPERLPEDLMAGWSHGRTVPQWITGLSLLSGIAILAGAIFVMVRVQTLTVTIDPDQSSSQVMATSVLPSDKRIKDFASFLATSLDSWRSVDMEGRFKEIDSFITPGSKIDVKAYFDKLKEGSIAAVSAAQAVILLGVRVSDRNETSASVAVAYHQLAMVENSTYNTDGRMSLSRDAVQILRFTVRSCPVSPDNIFGLMAADPVRLQVDEWVADKQPLFWREEPKK